MLQCRSDRNAIEWRAERDTRVGQPEFANSVPEFILASSRSMGSEALSMMMTMPLTMTMPKPLQNRIKSPLKKATGGGLKSGELASICSTFMNMQTYKRKSNEGLANLKYPWVE
ncbi:hypothetical protein M5D96_003570, partial [Drosophila gunungcola]